MPAVSLISVAAALGVASLLGIAWQRRNGRFTQVTASPSAAPALPSLGCTEGTPLTQLLAAVGAALGGSHA